MKFKERINQAILNAEKSETYDFEFYNATRDSIDFDEEYPILYRYSSADYYNIRALEKKQIFLSPIGKLNDIFECLSCVDDSKDKIAFEKLGDLAYVKSFSENKHDLLMWGLYGDNFSGICVAYDVNLLKNKQKHLLYHLYPISYTDKRLCQYSLKNIIEEYVGFKEEFNDSAGVQNAPFYLNDIMPLFLIKSKEWQHENEWRLFVTSTQMNLSYNDWYQKDEYQFPEFFDIKSQLVDFDCIAAIYLGPRIDPQKRMHIIEIAKEQGVCVYDLKPSKDKFALIESKIK